MLRDMKRVALGWLLLTGLAVWGGAADDPSRWQQRAGNVSIIRDSWGIAHVYGRTDADAVFGFVYAQAEDDFPRVELNYINALGRLAEVEGEAELYRDLRMKLFVDPADLQAKYAESPAPLRQLMDAFADGLNFFLHTHPQAKPRLITRFEPWMALSFTEGSIGGDIESINLRQLEAFYGRRRTVRRSDIPARVRPESGGSNGFAIAPALSASGHAVLMINPHTTFFFRPEIHMVSAEGLNAYGAVTWGQFFVYQGFNERVGWMHTSDGADVIDEYLETIVEKSGARFYRYGDGERPLIAKRIVLPYQTADGRREKVITAYFTHHGPIIREEGGKWVAVRLMQEPIKALSQSFYRTKARSYREFYQTMELRTNSSNNTVYADADGNIAYFHGNFAPIRDPRFDWRQPVDGSNPATEWKGLHEVSETITLFNPPNGWIQNTNNWPFTAAGPNSPRQEDYPRYLWTAPENARGLNAVRLLSRAKNLTLDSLIALAYDNYLIAFDRLLPPLLAAFDALPANAAARTRLAEPVAELRRWDRRTSVDSVPAALALLWAQDLAGGGLASEAKARGLVIVDHIATKATSAQQIAALERTVTRLERDFGTWRTPWGEINRFQRLTGNVTPTFDDAQPSIPIGFAPGDWGSLAAFGPTGVLKTKKIYGNRGNSFVAAVEFGPKVRAKTVLAGGVSGDPRSPHFNDQAPLYAKGQFKDALFYREDVERRAERTYHPGD